MSSSGGRVSAVVWRERVQRWRESGLSSGEFAKQEGIERPQALSWWANHLKRKGGGVGVRASGAAQVVRVVKVDAAATSTRKERVEILLPSGVRVTVGSQSDEQALVIALRALRVRS